MLKTGGERSQHCKCLHIIFMFRHENEKRQHEVEQVLSWSGEFQLCGAIYCSLNVTPLIQMSYIDLQDPYLGSQFCQHKWSSESYQESSEVWRLIKSSLWTKYKLLKPTEAESVCISDTPRLAKNRKEHWKSLQLITKKIREMSWYKCASEVDAAGATALERWLCNWGEQRLYNCDVICASLTCWPNDLLSSSDLT